MTSATQHCWQVLKHLVLYLAGNQDLCLSLNFKGGRGGLFHDYTADEHAIVEVFTDADDRRSISACAILPSFFLEDVCYTLVVLKRLSALVQRVKCMLQPQVLVIQYWLLAFSSGCLMHFFKFTCT